MKKKILTLLCLGLLFTTSIHQAKATNNENTFSLSSNSAVIMDANTKRVLYEYNGDTRNYPASITKVMTMLLGVEANDLTKQITISDYGSLSIEVGSSHISIMPQETMTMKDAIMAACLVSANDGANMIAEGVSGTIDNFVTLMNQRAKELGCNNTHFMNPHGLHDEEHYTTAIDMARIMSEAVNNDTYLSLTGLDEYEIPPTNKTDKTRYLYGQNKCMYEESEFYIPEVMSAKSGYTNQAHHTYVAYAKKGDVELVVCVMNSNSRDGMYTDLMTLFDYGFKTYSAYDGLTKSLKIPDVDTSLFTIGGDLKLASSFDCPAIKDNAEKNQYKFTYDVNEELGQTANIGDVVGKVNLLYGNEVIDSRALVIEKPITNILKVVFNFLLFVLKIIVILAVLGVVGLFAAKKIYTKYRNEQIRKKRRSRKH